MKHSSLLRLFVVLGLLSLVGCTLNVDSPQTPTVVVSPTLDETAIARRATETPTNMPSPTQSSTATPTTRASATHTATHTPQPTETNTLTASPVPTASTTNTATSTPTTTATNTQLPSSTPPASATQHPTPTATQAIVQLVIPTATPRASMTFTPFPTITPNLTQTEIVRLTPTRSAATPTPGGIYTLTATATAIPVTSSALSGIGDGTFYDPNAPASEPDTLPIAPAGESGPRGPAIPEQNAVMVSYAGQIVPVITVPDGISTGPAMAQGDIFTVNKAGQIAAVYPNGELYIEGKQVTISPSSQYGLHPNLSYGDLVWSPDGQHIAFRIDAANPQEFNGIDSGIWIFEPATNRSWQVFRNTYQNQVTQQHEQRRAINITWAPNSTALAIQVETPLGLGTVFLPATHTANEWIDALPYADATWARDSSALIVSGSTWNGPSAVGRVELDAYWTYTGYLDENNTGQHMQAAAQLSNSRIAFLGTTSPNTFALYTLQASPDAPIIQTSPTINGTIIETEWNAEHTAVLVTTQENDQRKLWIVRTDGVVRDTTPTGGALTTAHWR